MVWRNLNELIYLRDKIESGYDHYTNYIEDYRQEIIAKRNNSIISKEVKFLNDVLREFVEIYQSINDKKVRETLKYSKGFYSIELNGKLRYLKGKVEY